MDSIWRIMAASNTDFHGCCGGCFHSFILYPNVSFFWWSVCICYSVKFISSIQYISLCWLNKSDANKFNNFIGFVRARACLCMWVSLLLLFFCLNSSLLEMIIDSAICPSPRIDNNETRIGSNSQNFTSQWKIRQQAYGHSKATRQKRSYCVRVWEKKACVHPSQNHFFYSTFQQILYFNAFTLLRYGHKKDEKKALSSSNIYKLKFLV